MTFLIIGFRLRALGFVGEGRRTKLGGASVGNGPDKREEAELDLSEEMDELINEMRWLVLFKVHRPKSFSHATVFGDMHFAWKTTQEVTFKINGENLFLAQF